jgi:hypothetical protein
MGCSMILHMHMASSPNMLVNNDDFKFWYHFLIPGYSMVFSA